MYTTKLLAITFVASTAMLVASPANATGADHKNHKSHKDHKVGICHATGSKTNPYVFINVDKHAAAAHAKHHDGRDRIGVKSASDCPKPVKPAEAKPEAGKGGSAPAPVAAIKPAQPVATTATPEQPATLPETGAGLSALLGIPAMLVAGREYLRTRK